jgi:peptidoglycan/LPS O-acetylase OafA/YrhL
VFARQVTGRHYRDFLKARVARIYPLHLTVLLLFVATAIAERAAVYAYSGSVGPIPLVGERSLGGFFANLLMLQGIWARELSWNDPAWSISLEFLAYLVFPLLFPWLWRAAPIVKAGTGGLLLIVLGLLAYSTGGDFNQWNGIGAIMRCLPEFLIGALLYSAYREQLLGSVLAIRHRAADRNTIGLRLASRCRPGFQHRPVVCSAAPNRCRESGSARPAAECAALSLVRQCLLLPLSHSLVRAVHHDRGDAGSSRN